jgi:hypothetical protein
MKTLISLLALTCAMQALAQSEPRRESQQQPTAASAARTPSAAAGASSVAISEAATRRLFRQLDRNGDGYLTRDELTGDRAAQENWIAVDRDGDGRISPSEFGVVEQR